MGPAVIAAIIGAVTTAATTAASETANEVRSSGTWVSAIFENRTQSSFDVRHLEPNHGSWKKTASKVIGLDEFTQILETDVGPNDDDVKREIEKWIQTQVLLQRVGGFFGEWGMQGEGTGVEGVTVFSTPAAGNIHITCLIRKLAGGLYGAGVSMSNEGWLTTEMTDGSGEEIIDHIKEIHTGLCQFSEGDTKSVELGGFTVQFTGGQSVQFVVTQAGV